MSQTIPKSLFGFLKDLKKNNDRPWFNDHKEQYQEHQAFMKSWLAALQEEMDQHDLIEGSKLYRIYRDVRFSKDKTPYKTYFGGWLKRATKLRRGGYYFHIGPSDTIIAGGFWAPNAGDLKRIREEIAADDQALRNIVSAPEFQQTFGELLGEGVKTAPKGYSKDHPAIDLIRKKQFIVRRDFTDKEVLSPSFFQEVVQTYLHMRPFFDYMSDILTTDSNGVLLEGLE